MSKLIEAFFAKPIPEKLWHYTSVDALEGILSSQKIFATEAHHTTDPNEFIHARATAADYLARTNISDKAAQRRRKAAHGLLEMAFGQDGPLSKDHHQVFIASFSGSGDKRSQWESYSQGATGVSIAFDLRGVRPPGSLNSGITFAPCIYVDREKEKLLEEAVSAWTLANEEIYKSNDQQNFKRWLANQNAWDRHFGVASTRGELLERKEAEFGDLLRPAIIRASFDLLRIASHCKEGKYLDEDEWRLALPHKIGKPLRHSQIRLRGTNNTIPYIPHNLLHFRLPITELTIGARCPSLTRIRILLANCNVHVPLTRSNLNW